VIALLLLAFAVTLLFVAVLVALGVGREDPEPWAAVVGRIVTLCIAAALSLLLGTLLLRWALRSPTSASAHSSSGSRPAA
jgi:hypothetical protein